MNIKIKKVFLLLLTFTSVCFLVACGNKNDNPQTEEPTNIVIENGISNALKEDGLKFDRMMDFSFTKVEVNEEDIETLKSKYASQIPYVKYSTTFSLISVEMDMKGNYDGVYVFNNGEWQFSFGSINDSEAWEYSEKEASRVDKQRMLDDLKDRSFGTFEKGYVGNAKYSSIGAISNREYDETIHRDIINTSVKIKTDFAEYTIPVTFTYYFQKGIWELGDAEVADISQWELTYNNGSAPDFLSDNTLLSYITTSSNFISYICNLDYVEDYKITKESEVASKESVTVNYIFSVTYQYIGNVDYNVELVYEWLNNEWSEPQPTPSVKSANFSEMLERKWSNEDNTYFNFNTAEVTDGETVKLVGKYITPDNSVDIVANIDVMLGDNDWSANITDINGNQIWDIPSSSFAINREYGAIIYNDKYYAPVEINIEASEPVEEETITSNVLQYEQENISYKNEITRDGLMVNNISVTYDNSIFTLTGNVTNQSEGQSPYDIRIAMFDENDYIIAEGIASSGDSLLLPQSAAIFKIDVDNLSNEGHGKINKIIIYVKAK